MPSKPNRVPLLVRITRAPGRLLQWLTDVGAAIVSPFERAFSAVGSKFFAAIEGFQGVESVFIRIGWVLLWPLRMLWRLLQKIAAVLLPQSVRNILAAPFDLMARLAQSVGVGLMHVAERLNLDGLVLRIVNWTRFVWYPLAALWGFFHAWLATRSYKRMLWGLPVVVVLLPLAGITVWMLMWGRESVATQYRAAVNEARDAKNYELVSLYERKLAQLGVTTQMTEFLTATALAQDDKIDEAYERMQQLAPTDQPGYIPAHYWIIEQLLSNSLKLPPDESHRLLRIHIDHLLALGARGDEVELVTAIWLAQDKQHEEAAKVLKPIVRRLPPAAMLRMEITHALKQTEETRSDAGMVRGHMEDRARRGGTFSIQDYRSWAFAEEFLGNIPKAHSLVEKWLEMDPDSKLARSVFAELSRQLFDRSISTPDPDADRLAALFVQAAEYTDDPRRLQQQVAALYRLRAHLPVAQSVIDQIVDSPRTTSPILEAVGTVAATAEDYGAAKDYLMRAVKKDPKNSIAWNNYAWLLVQDDQADMQDALSAVNKALAIRPDEFRYRETRGQIMLRLSKWQAAIDDLEYAANGMPDSQEIHLSLAKAYDAVGEKHLAQVHRAQAE